jgi:glyoxylase-like metal-dependent hydrolase (beta-lactamase superfamily II)
MNIQNIISMPHDTPPTQGEVIEVAPGILWARMPLPMALDHVNIYALADGDGWVLVDTGMNSRKSRAILADLMAGPLGGKPIHRVLVTHHHPDHIGMAGWLQAEHGAQIWTSRTAWLMARMLVLDEQATWPAETVEFYRRAGMHPGILAARLAERPFNFADSVAPLALGFHRVDQDDVLQIGARRFQVHLGNGHAPHHITLWSLDDDVVIAGDQILPGISPNLGVYPTEPEADPVGEWLESCSRLLAMARPNHFVLPGHKLPFTGLAPRLTQLIENHHGALNRLRSHLREPSTAAGCFDTLYGRSIGAGEYGLALVEALGHLNHLRRQGEVERRLGADGAWHWSAV